MLILLFLIFACANSKDSTPLDSDPGLRAADCLQTYGDNCGCVEQCMTAEEIEEVQQRALCSDECGSPGWWPCEVVEGQCDAITLD